MTQQTFDSFTDNPLFFNGKVGAHQLELLIDTLQAYAGGPRGYRLRRIMLTNFWLYGLQEFEIPHGRLFLAGENASGKSTVLMAALPLALDGDLRPNRLDTFGGRERRIEYYVLGGTESATPFNYERRTAYIALEFEWCDADHPPIADELRQCWENGERERTRFLTIGISLAGNINASDRIRPLRFLITDGSRLGYDLHTVYEAGSKADKRAYDHPRFKQQLEGHGIICETQAEYERQVARYLFGFTDLKDFQKLINLLLVLRRPNLSSELSFSKVHDYLKQSLRKISGETTSRVIGTIERIDAIQGEIERIQEAYDAVQRLHQAQQNLALKRAQMAAHEYIGAQLAEDTIQGQVTRQRKYLLATENERQRAQTRATNLQAEQHQVSSQIKTLETSEGLQVAMRLTTARERVGEIQAQEQLQRQSQKVARAAEQSGTERLERQYARFEKMKAESVAQVRLLCALAREECYWEMAALQLEESLAQIIDLSPETSSTPVIPQGITALMGVQSEERIAWLNHLSELHQRREKLAMQLRHVREVENTSFQELDEARRRFQSRQNHFYEAQQQITQALEPYVSIEDEADFEADAPGLSFPEDTERFLSGAEELQPRQIVEQYAGVLQNYRRTIDMLEQRFGEQAAHAQEKLSELQQLIGGKKREVEEVKALYEQKRAEPELTPAQSPSRALARARLAEQDIPAIPLYALLDFAQDIDSESVEAGRIEHFLEDAGLLDALVIPPAQVAAADAILAAENLSDCRLDVAALRAVVENNRQAQDTNASLLGWLRFDSALYETRSEQQTDWQVIARTILATIRYDPSEHQQGVKGESATLKRDGEWRHGLLAGQAGAGSARYIGKATRLRLQQQELARLQEQQVQLETQLADLGNQSIGYEQQLTLLSERQMQLRRVLSQSSIEERYAELAQAGSALDDARGKYTRARAQTQEVRSGYNALSVQLERESNGIGPLASDAQRTRAALLGVVKLKNQAQALQNQLAGTLHAWEECLQARETLQQARENLAHTRNLYERIHTQMIQAEAEEQELQHIAASANAEELGERLRGLRARNDELSTQLEEARTNYARADERASNIQNNLIEAEERLREASTERAEKQDRFLNLLRAYPVEALIEAQQLSAAEKYNSAAQSVLRDAPPAENSTAQKELLEDAYRNTYNTLLKTFSHEQSVLIEYGPDLDEQGQVRFLNENRSRPIELLEMLSDSIRMQRTLLDQEERALFEDFLLQEMAEAIRTAIFEAEEWVQQINKVLSGLPMIGEHYALQWKPPAEYDLSQLGSHLAQHYKLLRKPAQALTQEETETLMSAFRREIEAVRLRQQESAGLNFMEALEQVFDYREWFHFDVWVTPTGGQRQRLTDRMAGTRSGAEQLFALYVPLFAALGALYRSAASGAPRLLALDEAFDKVSVANTQRILEFLVSQEFQWIMTGPQISGTGAKIGACARYLMIHEKGSPVATATASFWADETGYVH